MGYEEVSEIGIGQDGRLYLRPKKNKFPLIYRAAMEVQWDEEANVLWAPKRGDWSYPDWFKQVVASVESEYGTTLRLNEKTKWSNISEDLQKEITKASSPAN